MPLSPFRATARPARWLGLVAAAVLASCHPAQHWNATDVSGSTPDLQFDMVRASDGKTVTASDYRGKIVLLYFGYTYCPDVCPLTLSHVAQALQGVKGAAQNVRVLFVTVDPARDDLKTLNDYVANFGPEFVGLRGTPDELATLAKRYRVAYSVTPAGDGHDYEVTHSTAAYVFDRSGEVKLLFTDLAAPNAKLDGMTADLRELVAGAGVASWWQHALRLL